MKLETRDGRLFSLRVERYEFPDEDLNPNTDNPVDEFDTARFLIVAAEFRNETVEWSASGPIMTTAELGRLASWIESILLGQSSAEGVYFTERDLELSIDNARRNILVHVFWDFLPTWGATAESVTIEFPIDQIDLQEAVRSLKSQLHCFPGRPPLI